MSKKKIMIGYAVSAVLMLLFLVLTIAVLRIDVRPIGPEGSKIGLAAFNRFFFELIGTHLIWYRVTDWLGLMAIAIAFGFAVWGLVQLIARKSLKRVDFDLLMLGVFYIALAAVYALFEIFVVNYRPILIDGNLEASFPSSHTFITIFIMATAIMRFHASIRKRMLLILADSAAVALLSIVLVGRIVSNVHWATDILGGVLLAASFVALYAAVLRHHALRRGIASNRIADDFSCAETECESSPRAEPSVEETCDDGDSSLTNADGEKRGDADRDADLDPTGSET